MTEEEYALCRDIFRLEAAAAATRAISERRVRLFLCACALRVRHLVTRPVLLQTIETAFRFAEGLATREELQAGWFTLVEATREATRIAPRSSEWEDRGRRGLLRMLLFASTSPENLFIPGKSALRSCGLAADSVCQALAAEPNSGTYQGEMARCCEMFRDLFPYHVPVQPTMPPPWVGGDVALVARAIYEEERFEDMLILADALEDAVCDRPEVIAHCRQPGLHLRGCWAVDLILGAPLS